MNNNKNMERPRRITKLCQCIAEKYGILQKRIMDKATEFGYAKDIFEDIREKYTKIQDDPIFDGVEKTLEQHFAYIQQQEKDYHFLLGTPGNLVSELGNSLRCFGLWINFEI